MKIKLLAYTIPTFIGRHAIAFHLKLAFFSSLLFMIIEPMKRIGILDGLIRSPAILLLTIPYILMYSIIVFACAGVIGIPSLYWIIKRLQTNSKYE